MERKNGETEKKGQISIENNGAQINKNINLAQNPLKNPAKSKSKSPLNKRRPNIKVVINNEHHLDI